MNRRPTVDPTFIFGVSLVLSLVLWYPTLRLVLRGDIDITDAGIRYLLGLALAWAGVFGVCTIVAMYAGQAHRPAPPPPVGRDIPRRRVEDDGTADLQESEPAA